MDSQPRHAAAQVTLLEASFVFLPGLRRGENPSSEQHRQASKCCCRFASSSAEETDRIPVADQRSCAQPLRKQQRRGNGPHTGRRPAQLRAAASQAAAPRKRTAYWSPTSAAARSRFASSSAEETDRIPVADQRSCAQPLRKQQRRGNGPHRSPTSAAARSRFASSSAEETDRIPVADQRSCAQPPTPTAPAPRALASAAAAERRAAAAASSRQQQRRAASGSSNGEQPCASSHIKL
jgi:hypothetical protein